jgi:hypothetical protein
MRTMDEAYVKDFTIHNPGTGANVDADSTPSCFVYEDTTVAAILTPTVVKRGSLTGQYYISMTISAANGFEINRNYNVVIQATVGGVTVRTVVDSFCVDIPQFPSAAVVTDGGNSSTAFKTDRSEATNDYWKDALLLFITGNLKGQVKKVTAYNGTTKIVTVGAAYTGTPAVSDVFIFLNR